VGDQQHGHVPLTLFLAQQFEDLCLHRHVQRGGWLVGDQQVRIVGQRHRNHHTLALSTAEFMGVGACLPLRVAQADVFEQLRHHLTRFAHVDALVSHDYFCNLPVDLLHRVQGNLRLLKNHGDFVTTQAAQGFLRGSKRFDPFHSTWLRSLCVATG